MASNKNVQISEAELEIMNVLWVADEPVTAQYVSEKLKHKDWKYSTIATLLGRISEKGAVSHEKRGRFYYYTPCITKESYKKEQTRHLISKLYNGSVKNLVVSLFENKQMSAEDIAEIKEKFHL